MAKKDASEQIIVIQSLMLLAFGLAGYMSSSAIIDSFNAIRDPNSMVAIATDNALLTDTTTVDLTTAEAIVRNFRFICLITLTVASVLAVTNGLRLLAKKQNA
jgi:hypothetical protein